MTYFVLFPQGGDGFLWAYAACGFVTVAQFSYFGEYLPKAFPLHLRGTGGSFATNVGGRMIGTSAALLTANSWVAASIAVLALVLGLLLPESPADGEK